jgi:large subunit ribosomal protein L5e
MAFVKIFKNKAYFKRYQVKYRRRREGKTDFYARKRLITQDKNKYNSPKYRFVVRVSNKEITCQVAHAKIEGDVVVAAAYSHELKRYGMPVGLNNYAAAYATGLLLARRLLGKFNLADKYKGQTTPDGNDYNVEELADGPHPFRAYLDVGLHRTTTGSKIFAALKGATDGGIEVPHSVTRFVGYSKEEKSLKADILRKHLFGSHVADYMKSLREENPPKYQKLFSAYTKVGFKAEDLEAKWTAVHKAIRASPAAVKSTKPKPEKQKRFGKLRLTLKERKNKVAQKKAHKAKLAQQ